MRSSLLILVAVWVSLALDVDYRLSLQYEYDSNIGQNYREIGKGSIVPAAAINLTQPWKIPLSLSGDITWDAYVTERDFDDNSPFLSTGISSLIGSKKFSWKPELTGDLYVASEGYVPNEDSPQRMSPVLRTLGLNNRFQLKRKRHEWSLKSTLSLVNYGDIESAQRAIKNDKDAFQYSFTPLYRIKFKSKKVLRLRTLSLEGEWLGNIAHDDSESYNRFGISATSQLKLWKSTLSFTTGISRKMYEEQETHPVSGNTTDVTTDYFTLSPALEIPLFADMQLELKSKHRLRNSTIPNKEYDRHTASVTLIWDSSISPSKSKKKQGATYE